MTPKPPVDHSGLPQQLKRRLRAAGVNVELLRRVLNRFMRGVPYAVKYGVSSLFHLGMYPYSAVRSGDVVVQVGSPRDTLMAGRSRSVHFARRVGRGGRVIVIEPDPANTAALRRFLGRTGLSERVEIHECGAWSEEATLTFLASAAHPASSVLADLVEIPPELAEEREYQRIEVPVIPLDRILCTGGSPPPRLISITTNGAELQVLEGLSETLARGCEYISLAAPRRSSVEHLEHLGYECVAQDDRGLCFRRS